MTRSIASITSHKEQKRTFRYQGGEQSYLLLVQGYSRFNESCVKRYIGKEGLFIRQQQHIRFIDSCIFLLQILYCNTFMSGHWYKSQLQHTTRPCWYACPFLGALGYSGIILPATRYRQGSSRQRQIHRWCYLKLLGLKDR